MKDTAEESARRRVGNTEVLSLTDAVAPFPLPPGRAFPTVSEEEWRRLRGLYPETFDGPGTLRVRISCGLVRTPEHTILVDTGVGPSGTAFSRLLGTGGRLPERLRAAGVAAEDVDVVFLTHLHADHVGWNVREEDGRPTFPNARYVVAEADWEMCQRRLEDDPRGAAYVRENVIPLREQGRLELVDDRAFDLAEGVRTVPTPGHTPGHASVRVGSGSGGGVWLLGDVAAHPLQVAEPAHSYCFDADSQLATETRSRVLEGAEAEGAVVDASHFPEPGFGRLARREEKRYWRPG